MKAVPHPSSQMELAKAGYPLNKPEDGVEDTNSDSMIVAVRQNNILATAFHPELLPNELKWHR
jgi:hypothetical protein